MRWCMGERRKEGTDESGREGWKKQEIGNCNRRGLQDWGREWGVFFWKFYLKKKKQTADLVKITLVVEY